MDEPIKLFEYTISHGGGGRLAEQEHFYYHKNGFYRHTHYPGIGVEPYLLGGKRMSFEYFKKVYNELKKEYPIDEEYVDSYIREYQLKNLLS